MPDETQFGDPLEVALRACELAGKHLLNVLRSAGIQPSEIRTQSEALDVTWPTPWAYDAWCAWHACKIALRAAGWDEAEIAQDLRSGWRTRSKYLGDEDED